LLNHCEGLCSTFPQDRHKIWWTLAVPFSNPSRKLPQVMHTMPNKHMWKLLTSTQLRATWHTDSLDMVVLPPTGASCYHNCCIDGGTSPESFGYYLVWYTHITQSWVLNFENLFVHGVYEFFSKYNRVQNEDGLLWAEICNREYVLSMKSCVWWLFISSFANTHEWRTSSLMQYTSNSTNRQNHISKWDRKIRNSVHNVISNTDVMDGENSCWIHCSTKCRWQNHVT